MDMSEYQKESWKTAEYPTIGDNLYYPTLGLSGEAGEIANKVKKVMRDSNGVLTEKQLNDLLDELGDALWYIAALASELHSDLSHIAIKNLCKLQSRQRRGKIKGDGDNR